MILGEDFKFRDDIKADTVPIEILVDQFKGVTFRYTEVGFKEDTDGSGRLKFQYEITDPADFSELKLRQSAEFQTFLGLLLNSLILETVIDDPSYNRKGDSEESIAIE